MEPVRAGDLEPARGHRRLVVAYCRRRRWLTSDLAGDLDRRPEPADGTKAIPLAELERWRREGSGPPWYKSGRRVLYKREEVERWRREQDRK